jgi:hypothetical protein
MGVVLAAVAIALLVLLITWLWFAWLWWRDYCRHTPPKAASPRLRAKPVAQLVVRVG